jgi:hypothetical protein
MENQTANNLLLFRSKIRQDYSVNFPGFPGFKCKYPEKISELEKEVTIRKL